MDGKTADNQHNEAPYAALYGYQQQMMTDLLNEQMKTFQRISQGIDTTSHWEAKVAQTPHTVVYEEGKARLLYYPAKTAVKQKTPLLIVFSLINRSYILDLKPGKSIVEKMTEEGFDVYLIDWGVPGRGDQYLTLDDYVNRFMYRLVEYIKEHAEVDKISIMGYCMGGTISGMFASLHQESVKNLLLLAAPFDFSKKEGLLYIWADKQHFNVEKLVDALGNIPPWFLQSSFNLIKPMQNLLDKYVKFYEKIGDEKFVDDFLTLEYWLNDNVPLAGKVYKQFVDDCYNGNLLIQNKMRIGSSLVDLRKITCPVLSIVAEHDHLVPPCSSVTIHDVIGSKDEDVFTFPAGHIGLSVSGKAMKDLWPKVAVWLRARSDDEKTEQAKVPVKASVKTAEKAEVKTAKTPVVKAPKAEILPVQKKTAKSTKLSGGSSRKTTKRK